MINAYMVIGIKEDSGMYYAIDVFRTESEADAVADSLGGCVEPIEDYNWEDE